MAGDALEIEEVDHVGHEFVADLAVQLRGDVGGRELPHTGQAMIIAAGEVAEDFDGEAEADGLDGVEQRAGRQQVIREAARLFIADVFREGAVVAQDDVAQLAGQGAVDDEGRQQLVIGNEILRFAVHDIDGGKSILAVYAELLDDAVTVQGKCRPK